MAQSTAAKLPPKRLAVLRTLDDFGHATAHDLAQIHSPTGDHHYTERVLSILASDGYTDRTPFVASRVKPTLVSYATNKGRRALADHYNIPFRLRSHAPSASPHTIEHALGVTRFMLLAHQTPHARVRYQSDLLPFPASFRWSVPIEHENQSKTVTIIPDKLFALSDTPYYLLEWDRGTEPVEATDLNRSSLIRKMLVYAYTHHHRILKKHFAIDAFRVLFALPSQERINTCIDVYKYHLSRRQCNPKIFLFADHKAIHEARTLLDISWQDARGKTTHIEL